MESPDRAPANGLKLMAIVLLCFFAVALYGQWQRHQRAEEVRATIMPPAAAVSPTASPNDKP
jgi:hypothetical protein